MLMLNIPDNVFSQDSDHHVENLADHLMPFQRYYLSLRRLCSTVHPQTGFVLNFSRLKMEPAIIQGTSSLITFSLSFDVLANNSDR